MFTNDGPNNLSDDDKKRKRNSLQMEIIMLKSEVSKLSAEKDTLDAEIRKLRMDEERLRITSDEKRKRFDKAIQDILEKEAEIKSIKKKINLL
jgi:chromosome segregation ATPase